MQLILRIVEPKKVPELEIAIPPATLNGSASGAIEKFTHFISQAIFISSVLLSELKVHVLLQLIVPIGQRIGFRRDFISRYS